MNREQLLKELEAAQSKLSSIEQQLKEVDMPSAEQFVIDCIEGCVIHKNKDYPNSVFYMKEGIAWFRIEKPYLWVSYNEVWKVLLDQYGLKYDDIQNLIKNVVEKHFKWEGLTPYLRC